MQLTLFNHFTCDHPNTLEQKEPDGSLHHARAICGNCGKFIKWIPKPKPKPASVSIMRLLLHPDLEEWQKRFLKLVVYRTPNKAEEIVISAIQAKINPVPCSRGN